MRIRRRSEFIILTLSHAVIVYGRPGGLRRLRGGRFDRDTGFDRDAGVVWVVGGVRPRQRATAAASEFGAPNSDTGSIPRFLTVTAARRSRALIPTNPAWSVSTNGDSSRLCTNATARPRAAHTNSANAPIGAQTQVIVGGTPTLDAESCAR